MIRIINELWGLLPLDSAGLRGPVLIFDSLCLFLAALRLRLMFPRLITQGFIWLLFLIYPFLMFDDYRPGGAVIMLQENLRGNFLFSSPLGYLVVTMVIYYWNGVLRFR